MWDAVDLSGQVRVTAVPGRHGPAGGDRGPVIGFVLTSPSRDSAVYVSGDTVWFEGVEEIGRRFTIDVALLNMGAARVAVAGPQALTFTAADGVTVRARGLARASCRCTTKAGSTSPRAARKMSKSSKRKVSRPGSPGSRPREADADILKRIVTEESGVNNDKRHSIGLAHAPGRGCVHHRRAGHRRRVDRSAVPRRPARHAGWARNDGGCLVMQALTRLRK